MITDNIQLIKIPDIQAILDKTITINSARVRFGEMIVPLLRKFHGKPVNKRISDHLSENLPENVKVKLKKNVVHVWSDEQDEEDSVDISLTKNNGDLFDYDMFKVTMSDYLFDASLAQETADEGTRKIHALTVQWSKAREILIEVEKEFVEFGIKL